MRYLSFVSEDVFWWLVKSFVNELKEFCESRKWFIHWMNVTRFIHSPRKMCLRDSRQRNTGFAQVETRITCRFDIEKSKNKFGFSFFFNFSTRTALCVVYRLAYKRFTEARYCTFKEKKGCGEHYKPFCRARISYCIPLDLRCSIFRSKTIQDPIFFANTYSTFFTF